MKGLNCLPVVRMGAGIQASSAILLVVMGESVGDAEVLKILSSASGRKGAPVSMIR